jgi:hypothetical protein
MAPYECANSSRHSPPVSKVRKSQEIMTRFTLVRVSQGADRVVRLQPEGCGTVLTPSAGQRRLALAGQQTDSRSAWAVPIPAVSHD